MTNDFAVFFFRLSLGISVRWDKAVLHESDQSYKIEEKRRDYRDAVGLHSHKYFTKEITQGFLFYCVYV